MRRKMEIAPVGSSMVGVLADGEDGINGTESGRSGTENGGSEWEDRA